MSIVTLNDRAVRSVTAFGSLNTGSMVFIKKLTASSSSTLSFVDGASSVVLDNTYKEYIFTFKNIHPSNSGAANFTFQGSTDTGSSYGVTMTATHFATFKKENDSGGSVAYDTDEDLAQGTGFKTILMAINGSNNADVNGSGYLHLFNPSSTTFVKHFISRISGQYGSSADHAHESYAAGYFNTTSAIDAIQFKMSSGNIDAGDICLYGIL